MESRRKFLKNSGTLALGGLILPKLVKGANSSYLQKAGSGKFDFQISLAEFSFAGELMSGKMSNMEFPGRAKNEFGINVIECLTRRASVQKRINLMQMASKLK